MKTKIKAENIFEVQAIVTTLTLEYAKLHIEITNIMINYEMKFFITVNNKNIHALDIYTLLKENDIHTDIYYKINNRKLWAHT